MSDMPAGMLLIIVALFIVLVFALAEKGLI